MSDVILGLLQGLGPGLQRLHQEGVAKHQDQIAKEMDLLTKLSKSDDPEIRSIALAGMSDIASGREKPKHGFIGKLFGNYEEHPVFQQLQQLHHQSESVKDHKIAGEPMAPPSPGQAGANPQPQAKPEANPMEGLISPPQGPKSQPMGPMGMDMGAMSQPVSTPAAPTQINPQMPQMPQMPQAQAMAPPQPPPSMPQEAEPDNPIDYAKSKGFPTDKFGGLGELGTLTAKSWITGQETEKDRKKYEAQIESTRVRTEEARRLEAERLAGREKLEGLDHDNKIKEIQARGGIQKDIAGMRIAASAAKKQADASGGKDITGYTPEVIEDLINRRNNGEPITDLLPTGKTGNAVKALLANYNAETKKPRLTKDFDKLQQTFTQGTVAVDSIRKRLDELRKASDTGDKALAYRQFSRATSAYTAQIGRALSEKGVFTEQDRKTYQALINPGLLETLLLSGRAEKYLDDLKDHMERSRKGAVDTFQSTHSLGGPPSAPSGVAQPKRLKDPVTGKIWLQYPDGRWEEGH